VAQPKENFIVLGSTLGPKKALLVELSSSCTVQAGQSPQLLEQKLITAAAAGGLGLADMSKVDMAQVMVCKQAQEVAKRKREAEEDKAEARSSLPKKTPASKKKRQNPSTSLASPVSTKLYSALPLPNTSILPPLPLGFAVSVAPCFMLAGK
jgi:hypothetical protein